MKILYEKKFSDYKLFNLSIPFMFHSPQDCSEIQPGVDGLWTEVKEIFPSDSPAKIFYKGKEHLKTILCNLFMAKLSGKCLAVSRNNNDYTKHGLMGKYHVKQKILLGILDYLTGQGYVGYEKGRKWHGKVYTSRYWSLPKLYPAFSNWNPEDIVPIKLSSQLVILKNDDDPPKPIRYRNTEETIALQKKLARINNSYSKHLFDVYLTTEKGTNHLTRFFPRIVSIYNRSSWQQGGRLYNKSQRGLCYQQFSKIQRTQIRIDGERVVERDFASLHIHLLYAREGLQLEKDGYGFLPKEFRKVAKKFMLALLNAESERDALGAMYKLRYELLCCGAARSEDDNALLIQLNQVDFKNALKLVQEYHHPIRKYFCSGVGLRLQNQDAKIALELVHSFILQGVPVLPVHDSFIIPQSRDTELQEAMQYVYKEYTGGFNCPVA